MSAKQNKKHDDDRGMYTTNFKHGRQLVSCCHGQTMIGHGSDRKEKNMMTMMTEVYLTNFR